MEATLSGHTAAALVALLLGGCTTVDLGKRDPDWPDNMLVKEHKVDYMAVIDHCYKYISLPMKLVGGVPLACAEWDKNIRECDIWYAFDFALEHEREHCAGYTQHE